MSIDAAQEQAGKLVESSLRIYGVSDYTVVFARECQLGSGDARLIDIGERAICVVRDERGAPFALDDRGVELKYDLISHADENAACAFLWMRVEPSSSVMGVGIDLVDPRSFPDGPRGEENARLLLTDRDRAALVAAALEAPALLGVPAMAASYAFGAKEASFKACAAPLRRWYEEHEGELTFELRDFELASSSEAVGTARHGAAQKAMEKLGIARMVLSGASVGDFMLVLALAIGERAV